MAPKNYRATFTLPPDVATGLNRVAKRMGVSQSALLTHLIGEPLQDLEALMDSLPADLSKVTEGEALRLRGASADLVARRVSAAMARIKETS